MNRTIVLRRDIKVTAEKQNTDPEMGFFDYGDYLDYSNYTY